MKAKTVLIAVLVVLLAVLVIQNSELMPFRLLFWSAYMPVFILVIGIFAVGFIVGYLAAKLDRRKVLKKEAGTTAPPVKQVSETPGVPFRETKKDPWSGPEKSGPPPGPGK
jgi:uncharacterized integral membrane protein